MVGTLTVIVVSAGAQAGRVHLDLRRLVGRDPGDKDPRGQSVLLTPLRFPVETRAMACSADDSFVSAMALGDTNLADAQPPSEDRQPVAGEQARGGGHVFSMAGPDLLQPG